jgi:hypothetical protein
MSAQGSHHALISALDANMSEEAGALHVELSRAEQKRILLSAESASAILLRGDGARLVDSLRSAGAERVRVILYIRSPLALANAVYSELTGALATGGATFHEYLATFVRPAEFSFDRLLEACARDDVCLVARPYDANVRRGVVRDLLDTLNLDLAVTDEPRLNRSFGPLAIEALRVIGTEVGAAGEAERYRLIPPLHSIARSIDESPFWGIDESAEGVLAPVDRQFDALAAALWGQPWRQAIGEERRRSNRFDPATASQEESEKLRRLLSEMRHVVRESGAPFGD